MPIWSAVMLFSFTESWKNTTSQIGFHFNFYFRMLGLVEKCSNTCIMRTVNIWIFLVIRRIWGELLVTIEKFTSIHSTHFHIFSESYVYFPFFELWSWDFRRLNYFVCICHQVLHILEFLLWSNVSRIWLQWLGLLQRYSSIPGSAQ